MLAFFVIIFTFITICNTLSICDSNNCVCRFKYLKDKDFSGDSVQCVISDPDILIKNYTLPNVVHTLDLSSNKIITVQPSPLLTSTTMEELLLDHNEITDISNKSFVLPELKRLDLSFNRIVSIDKSTFNGVKNLEYLNIAGNRFTTFSNLMFHHLSNLNHIVLSNNNIGPSLKRVNLFDRSGFGLTNKIKTIEMSRINFDNVPENFFVDAYDIRKLVISNNNITDIFELPTTLEYLDLSDNRLSEINSEDFAYVPALKVLKLNNLLVKEIPEYVFEHLKSLKTLQLERNINLTEFSKQAFGNDVLTDAQDFTLEELSLKGSRLTALDEDLLEPFGRLTQLDLQGNPWQCDCNIKWVKDLQLADQYTEHVRCGTPSALFNAKIFDLKRKFFTCEGPKRHIGLVVALFSVCLILAIIAIWVFLCVPKRHSRAAQIREVYGPSAAYTALSVSPPGFNN